MRRLAVAAALVLAGCGGGEDQQVTVGAASSLTAPFELCLGGVRVAFGGSDDLAAQVRERAGIDVFAAANMELPEQLAADGLASEPVVFTTNELVLAVRRGSGIRDLRDVAGTRLLIGTASVPVGAYARDVIDGLEPSLREAVRDAVVSEEPDVKGIVGKLSTGAADAGFVYRTDVTATGGDLRAVPAGAAPVRYGVSVVEQSQAAEAVVQDILSGACADALREAGFGPP